MKVCSICELEKSLSEFNKNATKKDGLQSHCKNCNREKSANHYLQHKQDYLNNRDSRRIKLAQFVWDYLKLHPCVDCAETDPVVLEFDHLRDKILPISTMVHEASSLKRLVAEIDKCEVRCANCHRRKTASSLGWHKDILK